MVVTGTNVVGSYRRAIERRDKRTLFKRLTTKESHGNIARQVGEAAVLEYVGAVQRAHDPTMTRFAVLALCGSLPTEETLARSLGRASGNAGRGDLCKLCTGAVKETLTHALLECPHGDLARARAVSVGSFKFMVRMGICTKYW